MSFQPGDILLGKYRIEALVGQGAFAEVYRATHLALDAPRAIKVMRRNAPGLGSTDYDALRLRFQLEAQLGNRLDHPNLVRVYDFEQDGDLFLLVMEYAQGGSLDMRIQKARGMGQLLPLDEVIQVGLEVAKGLSALHALDVVHRDLKPSNILFDQQGHAKVADLGLAQIPGGPSMRSKLSRPPSQPGTAGYMSPEQEQSSPLLRPASDVYALGIVLFEMLTGRNYNYFKPGTRASSLRKDVPAWLDDLVRQMLSEEPKGRPWNGAEAASQLLAGMEKENTRHKKTAARRAAIVMKQAGQMSTTEKKVRLEVDERLRNEEKRNKKERRAAEQRLQQAEAKTGKELLKPIKPISPSLGDATTRSPWWHLPGARIGIGGALLAGIVIITLVGLWISGALDTDKPVKTEAPAPTQTVTLTPTDEIMTTPIFIMPTASLTTEPTLFDTVVPTPAEPEIGSTMVRPVDGMDMMFVPAGEFEMGMEADVSLAMCQQYRSHCDLGWWLINAEPVHTVILNAYWVDRTEVTNAMYVQCVQAGDCESNSMGYVGSQYDDHPVIYISWYDAEAYCAWADARLPTEAEWEKAARGMNGYVYPWGNDNPTCTLANLNPFNTNTCSLETSATGSFPEGASPYGALDMAGNVWEWVADRYDENYYTKSPESNPAGPSLGIFRVLRGGSWNSDENQIRSTYRNMLDPALQNYFTGFRCARSVAP